MSQVHTITPNFTIATFKMWAYRPQKSPKLVIFWYKFAQQGYTTKFGFGEVCTLVPNFTVVALKMWAYSPRNRKIW